MINIRKIEKNKKFKEEIKQIIDLLRHLLFRL
jgi:hypothetical protein